MAKEDKAVCGTCYDENDGESRPDCPVCGKDGLFDAAVSQFEHMSELAQGAVALHEMYLGLRDGGFNERQALYIIAQVMLGRPEGEA